jgi:hypothetical protein
MSKQENRVLVRAGARELTVEETDQVSAADMAFKTLVCTALMRTATVTGPGDGDGCSDSDIDTGLL